jgi:hypothetical protein
MESNQLSGLREKKDTQSRLFQHQLEEYLPEKKLVLLLLLFHHGVSSLCVFFLIYKKFPPRRTSNESRTKDRLVFHFIF